MDPGASGQPHPPALTVAAAVALTSLVQYLASRATECELSSEAVCWMIIPFLFRLQAKPSTYVTQLGNVTAGRKPTGSLWLSGTAVCIAALSFCKAEFGAVVCWFPLATPLLLKAQEHLQPRTGASRYGTAKEGALPHSVLNTFWGSLLAAAVAVYGLAAWDVKAAAMALIPFAVLVGLFFSLMSQMGEQGRLNSFHLELEDFIKPLSLRIVGFLIVLQFVDSWASGFPSIDGVCTVFLGVAKAFSWYFAVQSTRYTPGSWRIVTVIATFGLVATRNPYIQPSDIQALANVVASLVALAQSISMLPKHTEQRALLWSFALVPLFPYLANLVAIRAAESAAQQLTSQHPGQHPVAQLMEKAKADFDSMLSRQSKTYEAAVEEYKRRYKVEPPPGFRGWYDFAVKSQSPIIDDFDTIYHSVSPFWKFSGQEVMGLMNEAYYARYSELWLCNFHGVTAKTECRHPYRTFDRHLTLLFDTVLGDLAGVLPDIKFVVNHLDEPRVVIPRVSTPDGWRFSLLDMSHRPIWKELNAPCSSSSSSSEPNDTTDGIDTFGLPFVTSTASSLDICANPSYADTYGLFTSPVSMRLFTGLVPVLSTGAPSTMSDILYPSAAYIESGFIYDPTRDIPWEQKSNNLYWAGSTTGGYSSDSSSSSANSQWKSFHRQRFVSLAQNLNRQRHTYLRSLNGAITRVTSPFLNSRLFSVFFTRFQFCSPATCRAQRSFFRTKSYADKDEALHSRLVFDLDGNGISGRYYKLLASNSAVLKQTLLREWHDDRLVPWVHYFPVSLGMEEVPELVMYLTSTEEGRQKAREVAEGGKEWWGKALRERDMGVYLYRLLLEVGRLQDAGRREGEPREVVGV
ncbi:glycosyltransferase family 90 protein [Neurospora crassa]|uniref:Capsule protein n=1 Tax=Neurospora crassa (strain ATCC 24698 / 74-OR23-1A / CBS 708.71 / DSM 1257 / FGSC 987) TaxID=367110 RepID=V5IMB6_NEUCR|nr:capsule protein [Neurospora crassa OR74A]ESA42309.1 capsule protein [Neurospora crassa OR74A]KHE87992.1 glycosyltransferase family 90 protein [Neurospora crassa]|eukprot:XP_011394941.1 capsule protein [Neurospora crassa OR74A]